MGTVETFHRGTTGAGIALVAGVIADIAKVSAAGALQDIAAERRHVTYLLAGGKLERVSDDGIVALDVGVVGNVRHPRHRAEPQMICRQVDRRPLRGERVDVDQRARPHHVELHEVDQRGAAGERQAFRFGEGTVACGGGQGLHRRRRIFGSLVREGAHAVSLS
jgi:hypothetical protein